LWLREGAGALTPGARCQGLEGSPDQGPGFAPERAFREGHLGLATSRERAELLGGHLQVDSAPGAGARVSIRLPLRDPDPER
jgi:signal transduction histidine kinase